MVSITSKFKRRAILLISGAVIIFAICAIYVRTHPLVFNESFWDHAHCIKITGLSLMTYAHEEGHFPFHPGGYGDALLLLTNELGNFWGGYTGPGYDSRVFAQAARTGEHISEDACGRVYVQGLTQSDNPQIALLFDKIPTPGGDHCHFLSRLTAPLIREVWTVDGEMKRIPENEWATFSKNQIDLLVKAGVAKERAQSYYNSKPSKL